jgi:RNA polymerase sigma-70 factor (ECF subfamily)
METFRSEISLYLITTTMQYDSLNSVCADSCKPGMFPAGPTAPESITVLLSRVNGGDRCAFDFLIPLVYQELHRIAEGYLRRESQNRTLQPTALIHEAYLRLAENGGADYQNRKHFFAIAARVMRQILVDHARARSAAKRGANVTVMLNEGVALTPERDKAVIALDDALHALNAIDDGKARLVEMRFFGGMTAEEIADYLEIPVHIVRRELRGAQIWLRREIER